MAENDIIVAKEGASGGLTEIALAPSDIGAMSEITIASQITMSSDDVNLSAGRNVQVLITGYNTTNLNVTLPFAGNQSGDTYVIIGRAYAAGDLIIRAQLHDGSGVGPQFATLATVTGADQRFTFRFTQPSWSLVPVDFHTHDASAITSGTLAHERGGLEADVSAYNGLVKISGGSTSAVTVTSAGEALLDDADAAAQRTTLGLGTAAVEDTTAFAAPSDIPDPSSATPQALGTAAAGTSDDYSRADHVHGAPALNDLSNVSAAAPSDNDVLVYDNATSTWVAEAPAAGGSSIMQSIAVGFVLN